MMGTGAPGPVALAVLLLALPAAGPVRLDDLLARAGRQVAALATELPALVASESAVQTARSPTGGSEVVRRLSAEVGWMAVAGSGEVVAVRDVVEADGQTVTDRQRLERLLHESGPVSPTAVRAMLEAGAAFNLAPGSRNFNLPTVALFFLHPEFQPRFTWSRVGQATDGTWEVRFRERGRPTIIRSASASGPIVSRGRVWVQAESGVVTRTELTIASGPVQYWLAVWFAPHATLGLSLPERLEERYATAKEIVEGRATYSAYRRFQTGARLLP